MVKSYCEEHTSTMYILSFGKQSKKMK